MPWRNSADQGRLPVAELARIEQWQAPEEIAAVDLEKRLKTCVALRRQQRDSRRLDCQLTGQLLQIFERFYSLPRPATCRKCTGLGLALVREVARLHGGEASFENHPAGGGLAWIRLPNNS